MNIFSREIVDEPSEVLWQLNHAACEFYDD
jgi:hypothetical protein